MATIDQQFVEYIVKTLVNNPDKVVVERGLAPGETIISEGYHKLTPGMKVRVASKSGNKPRAKAH